MNAPQQRTDIAALKNPPPRENNLPDLKIDMFSLRGFELAQRIGRAFATSDAVPAAFRAQVLKKSGTNETWVENPAALGNCIVAIETAQAVGMSITAVMQNANVIEGKLSWSGKFIIAAVNASGRFTPLRFDVKNKGLIRAKYKEKGAWNNDKRRYEMTECEVEVENLECTAWALPAGMVVPPNIRTLQQAKEANLPVVESAPVSIKMAVEEGWYSKPGSKWQTEMKHLMLQYRAGAYFGNIHAPDVVMGMGRTSEELIDTIEVVQQPDGTYAANLDELRTSQPEPKPKDPDVTDVEPRTANTAATDSATASAPASADEAADETMTYAQVAKVIGEATIEDAVDEAADLIRYVADEAERAQLSTLCDARKEQLAQTKTPRTRAKSNMNVD